jgi:hypothetical protein
MLGLGAATLWFVTFGAPAAAPSGAQGCASDCAAIAEGTDRQTCLLQCEQRDTPRESGMTTWRREEHLGGAPPGSPHEYESGTTTRTETTTAEGTTTTITTTGKRGTAAAAGTKSAAAPRRPVVAAAAVNQAAAGPWIVLSRCQARCDPERAASPRAACKLRCLEASPGLVRRRDARPAPRGTRRSAPAAAR